MRIALQFLLVVLAIAFAQPAAAQCDYPYPECQPNGASEGVQKPDGWLIRLPFADGESVRVSSGYGPEGGSGLHCRSSDSSCANDWYALDLVLPNHPDRGKGQPVVAIAHGQVIAAGAGSVGWAAYGNRVYLEHEAGDGNTYVSMYAHLDSTAVSAGDSVSKGQQVGTLGDTCFSDGCVLSPHLHFAIHRNSSFGGSGSGGSYGGRSVIPEPIDGHTGLSAGDVLEAGAGPDDPDPPDPPDDPTCEVTIGAEQVVLEEDGPCAEVIGSPADATFGSGGHSYTTTLETPSPDYATGLFWFFYFASGGEYDVRVHVPEGAANPSGEATYKLQYAGGENTKIDVDQAASVGTEVRLGRFTFDDVSDQWLRLGDNYGDEANRGKTIVMDSVRLIPAGLCECDGEGTTTTQTCPGGQEVDRVCDGCFYAAGACPVDSNNSTGNNSSADDGAGGGSNANTGSGNTSAGPDGTTGANGAGVTVVNAEGGCGCSVTIEPPMATALLFLLGLLGIRGRRRVRRKPQSDPTEGEQPEHNRTHPAARSK